MIAELIGAAQSVQALGGLLKSANGLANYNEIVLAVSEVNTKLMQANALALSAQEEIAVQRQRIAELEREVAELQAWGANAEKYDCTEIAPGVFAYLQKTRQSDFEKEVKLCANCFEQRSTSILQQSNEPGRSLGLACYRCKSKITFNAYKNAA